MPDLLPERRPDRGYNLLEMLVCLLIVGFLASLAFPVFKTLEEMIKLQKYRYQDEIGIYQLQITLACNNILEVDRDEISYQSYEHDDCLISVVNDNLIAQPGWVCFLHDIDDVTFRLKNGIIYLEYAREGEYYEYPIAYYRKPE
ncbi:MAG: prepilin-type N-terminal cleavage/methylation domain-containing protein [Erysipelotrichaceae bacterium]|nr:prepilin-type N-terminal cleavage/methylation domain-containing protein [Erysipelotrichaceae bacterium]